MYDCSPKPISLLKFRSINPLAEWEIVSVESFKASGTEPQNVYGTETDDVPTLD